MKKTLKICLIIVPSFMLAIVVLLFSLIKLEPQYERTSFAMTSITEAKKNEIKSETADLLTDKQLFDYTVRKVASELHFTERNDLTTNSANCIGYAALAKGYLNYALAIHGKSNKTYHYVGLVNSCGINLNKILMLFFPAKHKGFVKDHDFIGMKTDNGELILASPTLYDLIGNRAMTTIE